MADSGTRFCCQSGTEIAVVFEAKILVGYQLCEYKHAVFLGGILKWNIICSWKPVQVYASGRRQVVGETGRGVGI